MECCRDISCLRISLEALEKSIKATPWRSGKIVFGIAVLLIGHNKPLLSVILKPYTQRNRVLWLAIRLASWLAAPKSNETRNEIFDMS